MFIVDNLIFNFVFTVRPPSPPSVPVRHWSFDNLDGLVLMEGNWTSQLQCPDCGKGCKAVYVSGMTWFDFTAFKH